MTTPPNPRRPRPPVADVKKPTELSVAAQARDAAMDLCGTVRIRFVYDPADPYALTLHISDPWGYQDPQVWTASREVFAVAALWGIELPGMDLTVTPLTVTRATPGQPVRDVPCLRVALRHIEHDGPDLFVIKDTVYLDIVRAEVIPWFQQLTVLVQMGKEYQQMDIDDTIARLLDDPSYRSGK